MCVCMYIAVVFTFKGYPVRYVTSTITTVATAVSLFTFKGYPARDALQLYATSHAAAILGKRCAAVSLKGR